MANITFPLCLLNIIYLQSQVTSFPLQTQIFPASDATVHTAPRLFWLQDSCVCVSAFPDRGLSLLADEFNDDEDEDTHL